MGHAAGQTAGGDARPIGVHLLMERVDPEAEAMRQESQTTALVEDRQIVPERGIIAKRQIGLPGRMTLIDQLGHDAVLQIGRLRRHVDVTHRGLETAARSRGGAEGVRHQLQEQERQRDVRRAPDGLAQRQGPVGGQFHDQPFGQRLQRAVVLLLGRSAPIG
jgi:hypothetical protein